MVQSRIFPCRSLNFYAGNERDCHYRTQTSLSFKIWTILHTRNFKNSNPIKMNSLNKATFSTEFHRSFIVLKIQSSVSSSRLGSSDLRACPEERVTWEFWTVIRIGESLFQFRWLFIYANENYFSTMTENRSKTDSQSIVREMKLISIGSVEWDKFDGAFWPKSRRSVCHWILMTIPEISLNC